MRCSLRSLLPCCCAPDEDEEPLRFPHAGKGISSADARPEHVRGTAEIAAEAARAQDWCWEHLETLEEAPPPPEAGTAAARARKREKKQRIRQQTRAEAPSPAGGELELAEALKS